MMKLSPANLHPAHSGPPHHVIEVIQRHGSQGFGKGQLQSLFESIEMGRNDARQSVITRVVASW